MFALPKDKAVGPDRFPTEFFQKYWDIIANDLHKVVTAFYHNQLDLWRINKAYITLIPKKDRADTLSDYRPISVLSSIPKIITKILASRQQPFLPALVNQKTKQLSSKDINLCKHF
jgi:hypothetical protein